MRGRDLAPLPVVKCSFYFTVLITGLSFYHSSTVSQSFTLWMAALGLILILGGVLGFANNIKNVYSTSDQ